jgi:hypothetical protein
MTPESSSKALAVNAKCIRKIVSIERELFTILVLIFDRKLGGPPPASFPRASLRCAPPIGGERRPPASSVRSISRCHPRVIAATSQPYPGPHSARTADGFYVQARAVRAGPDPMRFSKASACGAYYLTSSVLSGRSRGCPSFAEITKVGVFPEIGMASSHHHH